MIKTDRFFQNSALSFHGEKLEARADRILDAVLPVIMASSPSSPSPARPAHALPCFLTNPSEAFIELVDLSSLLVRKKHLYDVGKGEFSYWEKQINFFLEWMESASPSEIKSLDRSKLKTLTENLSNSDNTLLSDEFVYNRLKNICDYLENATNFIISVSEIYPPNPIIMDNFHRLLLYFGKNGRFKELLPEFSKLSQRELELSLLVLEHSDIRTLANNTIPFILNGPDHSQIITTFQDLMKIPVKEVAEIQRLYQIMKILKRAINPTSITTSPPLGLALSNGTFTQYFSADQKTYQVQFMATLDAVSRLISSRKSFQDCLDYVASERNKMEPKENNPFGISRKKEKPLLNTQITGRYRKYFDLFLQNSKSGWIKKWTRESISYTMFIKLDLIPFSIKLTTILLYPNLAVWKHTPFGNIHLCLTKAKALFDHAITLSNPDNHKSLNILIEAVAELHWLLAHTVPYQRGSAAITKMLIGGILKSKGVEPGGFGNIEPDCIALTQSCEEFVTGYFDLMQFPPAHITPKEALQ